MFIYGITLLISLFFAYLYTRVRVRTEEKLLLPLCFPARHFAGRTLQCPRRVLEGILFVLSAAPLILLSGLRYAIGVDYFYTYVPRYQLIAAGASLAEANTEPGFYLLVKLICLMGGGTVWMFLITAALTVGLFWLGFARSSDDFCLSVVLFVGAETYFISLCYVRQFMAAAILFYGLRFVREKKPLQYALCVLAAFLFHKSAVLFLPLYLLAVVPLHPLVLIGGIGVLSALHDPLRELLNWVVTQTKYAGYVDSIFAPAYRIYPLKLMQYSLLFLVAILMYRYCKKDPLYRFSLGCLALLVYITCNFNVMPQTDRICWYLEIVNLLLIPMVVKRCPAAWLRPVLAVGITAVFAMVTIDGVFVQYAHGVVPYRFVFAPSAVIW